MSVSVEVRLVGALVIRGPDARNIGGDKPRTLLALLAVHRHRLVTADQIAEALWGARPPRRPGAGISTVVSRLRRTLGPEALVGDCNGYRLGGSARVDLYEAKALIEEAESRLDAGRPAGCLLPAVRGLELVHGGTVLADFGKQAWIEPARTMQVGLVRRGRQAIAEAALRNGDPERARGPALAAIVADPLDEVAHRALMRAHALSGRLDRALRAYDRLRAVLATELGIDPAPLTRDLYRTLLRRHRDTPRHARVPLDR